MSPVSDTRKTVLLDKPKEVDVGAIEQELVQLWKNTGGGSSGTDAPVIRACSLNLVIFTEGADRTPGLEEIVSQIAIDHPSRIFLVAADRSSAKASIGVWVSARCSLPVPGGKQVCCEEIDMTVAGTDAGKVPSIVTSLLVPDVPTILLWRARLDVRDQILRLFTPVAERILIDSSEELRPLDSLVAWGQFMTGERGGAACGDLAWTHLTHWRGLLAQSFQPPATRVHLATLDRVTVEYTSSKVPMHSGLSQSLLAAAWLSHVLGWVLIHPFNEESDRVFVAKLRQAEQAITIQVREVPQRDARPGGIASIALHSAQGGEIALRSVPERDGCITLRSSLPGSAPTEDILVLRDQTEAELVSNELEILYHDPMFGSTMSVLAGMLRGHS